MNIPQWIMAFLLVVCIYNAVVDHGRVEVKKHNGFEKLFATLIEIILLVWGGYFNCWLRW